MILSLSYIVNKDRIADDNKYEQVLSVTIRNTKPS